MAYSPGFSEPACACLLALTIGGTYPGGTLQPPRNWKGSRYDILGIMKTAATATLIFSFFVLAGGIADFIVAGSSGSLVAGIIFCAALLALGRTTLKGTAKAGYASGALAFFLAIFFAYRFLSEGLFFPNGVLMIVGFFVLFSILLGVFMSLQEP